MIRYKDWRDISTILSQDMTQDPFLSGVKFVKIQTFRSPILVD